MLDPAALLDRVPELEAFLADQGFRRALGTGDPFAVYRFLFWRRLFGSLPRGTGAVAADLLKRRRYFGVPLAEPPSLMRTVYGSGLRLYGEAEREKDGGYIATRYLTFAAIPLFPLASYLVRAEQRAVRFVARVPFSWLQAVWNGSVVLALIVVVAVGAWGAWRSRQLGSEVQEQAFPASAGARWDW